jgi:hypothetical protein
MRGLVMVNVVALCGIMGLSACAADGRVRPLRQNSQTYSFEIAPDDVPPHARQPINYKVVIYDRKSRQPIENGEGRIFASDSAGAKTWDGFKYGPEIGTYHAKVSFIMPGLWALAIQFRRDTLHPVERIDWYQDVHNERTTTP